MPSYEYVCRDIGGILVRGIVEAEDDARARARLQERGLFVTGLRARPAGGPGRRHRGGAAEIALLTRHLALLVGAGLPLFQALRALGEQSDATWVRDLVQGLAQEIQEGRSLSAALQRHPDLFSRMYVGMVQSGEVTGYLDRALDRLATHLERDLEFQRKVRDAVVYPAFVLALAGVVMAIFMTLIIPAFERVYRTTGARLPLLTQGLIGASTLFRSTLPVVPVAGALLLLPQVRQAVQRAVAPPLRTLVLLLPQARGLAQTILVSRFLRAASTMFQSGVPVLAALDVGGQAAGNPAFAPVVEGLKEAISQGQRLSEGMRQSGQFPPIIVRMVALGEESGQLDAMLERAGVLMDAEFDLRIRRLLTFLEPAFTLLLGAVVGVILLALYLPIFGLARAIAR